MSMGTSPLRAITHRSVSTPFTILEIMGREIHCDGRFPISHTFSLWKSDAIATAFLFTVVVFALYTGPFEPNHIASISYVFVMYNNIQRVCVCQPFFATIFHCSTTTYKGVSGVRPVLRGRTFEHYIV